MVSTKIRVGWVQLQLQGWIHEGGCVTRVAGREGRLRGEEGWGEGIREGGGWDEGRGMAGGSSGIPSH